jgi:hypothetical protein
MAKQPDKLDKEVTTRKAEGKVRDLVKRTAAGTPVKEQARQSNETKVRAAEGRVKDLVKSTAEARKAPAAEPSTWSKVKDFASRNVSKGQRLMNEAGTATRGALRAGRGKGGPIGALLLGASVAMEAGHALDEHIAKKRAEAADKPAPKDDTSAGGPRRNAASVAAADKPKQKEAPKEAPKEASKSGPAAKPAAAKPASKSTSKPASSPTYPVYKKGSSNAASFRTAFAAARKAGKGEFTWEGRRYNTKLKGK